MFTKIPNIKKWNDKKISLRDLYDLVRNNPNKEIIEYLRSIEYKSEEYNNIKKTLPAIMPHGEFRGLKNSDLLKYSGYLYFDVDGIDTFCELNDTIQKTIDTIPVAFLQRSISNRGYHFLVKIDDTLLEPNDTFSFSLVYDYVRELLIDKGINVDVSAGGLVRKMIISSDTNVYLNDTSFLVLGIKTVQELQTSKQIKRSRKEERESTIANDTLIDENQILNIHDTLRKVKLETKYDDLIFDEGRCYVIQSKDYYKIVLPRIIKDGSKHRLYTRIINAIYYINGNSLTRKEILSYIFYINNRAEPKMEFKYLKIFVNNICDQIEQNGVYIKTRIKLLHFKEEFKLTKKQKQIMGSNLAAKRKVNNSIKKICDAKLQLCLSGKHITQKNVQEITKLGIATIKRHWNREYLSFDIDVPEDQPFNDNLPTISMNEFENMSNRYKGDTKEIKFKYKGMYDVDCEFSTQDKEEFINYINSIENPYEDLIINSDILTNKIFQREKLWFMYSKWVNKNLINNNGQME